MPKIFISYSRADGDAVTKLVGQLVDLSYDVLLDKKHMHGGRSTVGEIHEKIEQSEYFVPVITSNAKRSSWVGPVELKWARKLQKQGHRIRILPLHLKKVQSSFRELANLNYVDFTEDYCIGLAKLVQALPNPEYDELSHLRGVLDKKMIQNRSLLSILRRVATRKSGRPIDWSALPARRFMEQVGKIVKDDESLDTMYWRLIVCGVLKFKNIKRFWHKKDYYTDSAKYAEVANRGAVLMDQLSMESASNRKSAVKRRASSY